MERTTKAFSGQGAQRKIPPEIEKYVRDRFGDLHGACRDYNQVIRAEVWKYFKVSICSERMRWIFKQQREKLAQIAEPDAAEEAVEGSDWGENEHESGLDARELGANSCERGPESSAIDPFLSATRNYSLPPRGLPCSGRSVPEEPTFRPPCGDPADEPLDGSADDSLACAAGAGSPVDWASAAGGGES